jgi:hypothetical protein
MTYFFRHVVLSRTKVELCCDVVLYLAAAAAAAASRVNHTGSAYVEGPVEITGATL